MSTPQGFIKSCAVMATKSNRVDLNIYTEASRNQAVGLAKIFPLDLNVSTFTAGFFLITRINF